MMFSRVLAVIMLAALLPGQAVAQNGSDDGANRKPALGRWIDPGWRRTLARHDVRFEEDGTSRTVFEFEILLTDSKGLRSVAQQVFGYNSYFKELAVSDLATVKADGRLIPVDPRAVNDQPAFANPSSPYFDESRIVTISYPDVAPGDRVRGRLVYSSKRPEFPGAFAHVWEQPQDRPPETMELTLNGPASRPLRVDAIGVEHTESHAGDRIVHHVVFHHETPTELHDAENGFDTANRFEVSTFADYASFAALVRKWNAPMAVPDDGVRRLSQDIVGDATDDLKKAERIFNWVAKNIRYVGIGFADGGFTSQPVAAIIRDRYGDCKAHATVLKSLLAAQGIEAHFAMINLGSGYTIPGVATPNFDHAIVYLPKFDRYLDATSSVASFAALPASLYGKPVLDVDSGIIGKVPPATPADFVVRADTTITFDAKGIRSGNSTLSGERIGAHLTRSYAARLERTDLRVAAEKELQHDSFEGTGSYSFTDPREPSDSFAISASFEAANPFSLGRDGNIRLFLNSDPRPSVLELITNDVRSRSFRCLPIDYTESSTIALPEGLNLAQMPLGSADQRELKGETRYGAVTGRLQIERRVALDGRKVHATSHVTAAFDAAVCPAKFYREIEALLQKTSDFRGALIALTPRPVGRVIERGSTFQLGVSAYQAGDYETALREWRPIAEHGDSDAQVYLGSMYKDGQGVAQDYAQAIAWYTKAAERDNALAQAHLGFMYSMGFGVAADQEKAAEWFRKSAELGDAYSQCSLAEMYESGKGVAKDFGQALLWYTKAAEQGYSRAAYLLGLMYQQGKGIPVDYTRANAAFRKAADKGYALAQVGLGGVYYQGIGVDRDYAQAVQWFRKAAERGDATGQYDLGYAYEIGMGVTEDTDEAKRWYARAASQGYADARDRLSLLQMRSGAIGVVKRIMRIFLQ